MADITDTLAPKSDQLNADDLQTGPRTFTVERVEVHRGDEQPVHIHLAEYPGRPWKPSKSMRRVIAAAWGTESNAYPGRHVTLHRNPDVTYGGKAVGGIEISALSHLEKPLTMALTAKRGRKRSFTAQPLPTDTPTTFTVPDFETVDEYRDHYTRRQKEGAPPEELEAIYTTATTKEKN